jgi:hypothetical protein
MDSSGSRRMEIKGTEAAIKYMTETTEWFGRVYAEEILSAARWAGDGSVTVHGLTIACDIAYGPNDEPAHVYTFTGKREA